MNFKKIINYENPKLGIKILRIGLGLTILWFGVMQLLNQSNWTGYVPVWVENIFPFISLEVIVIINGLFETLTGILLVFNKFVKISSILLSIHLIIIIIDLGINEIGVRDIGILTGLISLYLIYKK